MRGGGQKCLKLAYPRYVGLYAKQVGISLAFSFVIHTSNQIFFVKLLELFASI